MVGPHLGVNAWAAFSVTPGNTANRHAGMSRSPGLVKNVAAGDRPGRLAAPTTKAARVGMQVAGAAADSTAVVESDRDRI